MSWRPAKGPGPGSWRVLGWVARLGTAGLEPLGLALGLSQSAVYSHVARLEREGLVARVSVSDGQGGIIALTRAGAREAEERGATAVSPRSIERRSAVHGRAVSWFAASADVRGWQWLGPAELRADGGWFGARDDGVRHAPDLGVVHAGARTAIEVELHAKAPRRLAAILRSYRALIETGSISSVTYVTGRPDVEALVRRQVEAAGLDGVARVGSMETIVSGTRGRGSERQRARIENSLS